MSVLVCVVKGGYHSVSQYQWYCDDRSLSSECYPVLYTSQCGMYMCQIHVYGSSDPKEFKFTIEGILLLIVHVMNVIADF